MNRATLRTFARSKLQDLNPTPALQIYSDSQYNTQLLQSAYFVQSRLAKVNNAPFTRVAVANQEANVADYPLPSDITTPGVRRLYALSNSLYIPYRYVSLDKWEDSRITNNGQLVGNDPGLRIQGMYTTDGDYFLISPTPTALLTNGLRVRYAAVVTMAEDTSIPQLPLALHPAIWLHTAMTLAPQQDESLVKTLSSMFEAIMTPYLEVHRERFGTEVEQVEDVGGLDKQAWKSSSPATSQAATRV